MKILTYNFKGGVGKTAISLNYALTENFGIISNDEYSSIHKVLPKEKVLKLSRNQDIPDLPDDYDVIFDLGGYPDKRAVSALKSADVVLVPVVNEEEALRVTTSAIQEMQSYNENIIIIANKITGKDLENIDKIIKNFFDFPIFPLKKSRIVDRVFQKKQSMRDISHSRSIFAYHAKPFSDQFDQIINFINENYK